MKFERHVLESMAAVMRAKTDLFPDLVRLSDLDPSRDFAFGDLRHVNFDTSDLTGFDLTGADLRGAKLAKTSGLTLRNLVGVKWDRRTSWPGYLEERIRSGGLNPETEAKRMILSGETPPKSWAPFIRQLDFTNSRLGSLYLLHDLKSLEFLTLIRTSITDIRPLKNLKMLQSLNLMGTQVFDLSPLQELRNLMFLGLKDTPVSDLKPLRAMKQLTHLILSGTRVTDSDIEALVELTALRELSLTGTLVRDVSTVSAALNLAALDFDRPTSPA